MNEIDQPLSYTFTLLPFLLNHLIKQVTHNLKLMHKEKKRRQEYFVSY